ncbi:ABC transporter ATP-binding protein [Clostridium sp. UBA4548]|uniref:ABC transporter ATP-binding protein n=1 Tax=Clostridium sp. UBA4548 TaxID=1946361 RepID=UPI0025C45B6B|nr:ABC transporter ATP-binding protein [Clostridium sp. UBA4548]
MGKKIIMDFIKNHKVSYIIGIGFMFLTAYIQSLFPTVLGEAIDVLKINGFSFNEVKLKVMYMLFIAIGAFITTYAWRNFIVANARSLECHLREKLYDHLQILSQEFYNKRKTGDLIAYAINDISAVRMTFGPATAMTINGIVICAISIYLMCITINWRLTLITLLPIPFIVIFMMNIGKKVQKRFKIVQENFAAISDKVQENINGIRVIKAYVQEEYESKNFEKLNIEMMDSNLKMIRVSALLSPFIEIAFSISFATNLIVGGNMVLVGSISLGDFIAFNGYLTMIMKPINSIGRVITIFQRGVASLKRLNEVFDVEPEIKDGKICIDKPLKGEIEFRDLSFSYPNSKENSIEEIGFKIPQGSTVGILGKTGSGKTTLVNLLLKLYNVEDKKVFIDGIDINEYSLKALREGVGYVPQENFLFSASIKDNIKFFKDTYKDIEVEEAAKISSIYESIVTFPKGFDTILGERGVNLSGGQKQRISIARAVIKNPSILILDDSLSAVDTVTESRILKNLKKFRKDKTTLIIAHRISAIKDADYIIVLKNGKIYEQGHHNELIKRGGIYYETYMEQYKDSRQ